VIPAEVPGPVGNPQESECISVSCSGWRLLSSLLGTVESDSTPSGFDSPYPIISNRRSYKRRRLGIEWRGFAR